MTSEAVEVFFSYSHKDEDLRDELATHLAMLKNQGLIKAWHDREISAGTEWANAIDENLNSADVILLLVSANFLASRYCYDIEMERAMKRHEAGEARVIPIILKPVDWSGATFGKLQALPKNAKPITIWQNHDEAFLNVAQGIRRVVEEIAKGKAGDEGSETLKQPIVPVTEPELTLKTQPLGKFLTIPDNRGQNCRANVSCLYQKFGWAAVLTPKLSALTLDLVYGCPVLSNFIGAPFSVSSGSMLTRTTAKSSVGNCGNSGSTNQVQPALSERL